MSLSLMQRTLSITQVLSIHLSTLNCERAAQQILVMYQRSIVRVLLDLEPIMLKFYAVFHLALRSFENLSLLLRQQVNLVATLHLVAFAFQVYLNFQL